jgi:carboxylesterase
LINPAIATNSWQLRLVPALKHLVPSLRGIGNDIKKPGTDEVGYRRTPLRALHTLVRAWPVIEADLARITAPLLMFRSMDDHVVDETSVGLIKHGVSSPVAEYVTLTDSYHVATLDFDAQLIFDRSAEFLTQHLGSPR